LTCINIVPVDAAPTVPPSLSGREMNNPNVPGAWRELRDELETTVPGIQFRVVSGVVTLSGIVASYGQKMAAVAAAWGAPGVEDVVNQLEVAAGDEPMPDAAIAMRANSILRWDATIPEDAVQVIVEQGRVRLMGHVPTRLARTNAERDLRNLVGVTDVVNDIVMDAGARWGVRARGGTGPGNP
jgi:osmotically-inducible protein OsmY